MTDALNIENFLPQGPPFIMVGSLIHADGKKTISGFRVAGDNVLVEDGLFTEAGLLENIAQTAAAGAGAQAVLHNEPPRKGYIARVRIFLIVDLPKTGDELVTEVSQTESFFPMQRVEGKVYCREKLLAQCQMTIFLLEESK